MAFQKVRQQDVDYLRSVLAEDRVLFEGQISDDFSHDEMQEYGKFMPEVVVEPVNTEEVSAIMKYAHEHNIPVTPRGSGTGLCGGAVAIHGGIMLSTLKMNQIIEIDEENLMGRVQSGVLLMDFTKAVQEKGLFYPPDPGEKSATLGGNVSTNAGGMRAVKYGVTRDFVRGMKIVLANGEIIDTGGKVIKNSSGYSIKDMMVGAEGTLGVVTEIIVRLLPLPKKAVSLLVPFDSLDECIETVPHILRSRSTPTAVEFLQRETIINAEEHLGKAFPDKSADAYLLLSFDGNSTEEIEAIYDEVAQLCLNQGALDVYISNTQERHESIWSTRAAFLEAIKGSTPRGLDECDVVVPKNRVADFVKFCAELTKEYGVRIRQFGHAGDGNLHVYCCKDQLEDSEWKPKVEAIMQRMYDKAIELEGQISGEHGVGHAKIGFLGESIGPTMNVLEGIKKAFDPNNILNPGKVVKI